MRRLLVCFALLAAACSSTADPSATVLDGPGPGSSSADQSEAGADSAEFDDAAVASDASVVGRTNVTSGGNRYLPGSLDLADLPEVIQLDSPAIWILPLDDGSLVTVAADGSASQRNSDGEVVDLDRVDPSVRPLAYRDGDTVTLAPANADVASDLPDATEVGEDGVRAWFDGATDRVPHGALGDTTESTRLVIARRVVSDPMDDAGDPLVSEAMTVVDLEDEPNQPVFEGLSPLLADVDGDGVTDVVTTISDRQVGARLAVFDQAGQPVAESQPIGQGNRWRHQIAVAPTGPDGQLEVIEVQTPHLSGDLQFQRFDGGTLMLQHTLSGFRSHVLGSRNLDGAVVFDADGDGDPEVVVPALDLTTLAVVEPGPGGNRVLSIDLAGSTVSSNLALANTDAGLVFAVGAADGTIRVWRGERT